MKHVFPVIFLLSCTGLAGCNDKVADVNVTPPASPQNKMLRDSPGKPVAPVALSYAYNSKLEAGLPVSITITLTPAVDADSLLMQYHTSELLIAGDNLQQFEFNNTPAGTPVTQTIQVIPQDDGSHAIQLSVTIISQAGRSGTRSFSIPVQVGKIHKKPALPEKATIKQDTRGERLLIQKGKEHRETN